MNAVCNYCNGRGKYREMNCEIWRRCNKCGGSGYVRDSPIVRTSRHWVAVDGRRVGSASDRVGE